MKRNSNRGAAIKPATTATATISLPLPPEIVRQFDVVCTRQGKTREALFLEAVKGFIKPAANGEAGGVKIPDDATVVYQFEGKWDRVHNSLIQDTAGLFYLATTDCKFDLEPDGLSPVRVSAEEAGRWWLRCNAFSSSSSGDASEIIEALLKASPAN